MIIWLIKVKVTFSAFAKPERSASSWQTMADSWQTMADKLCVVRAMAVFRKFRLTPYMQAGPCETTIRPVEFIRVSFVWCPE
jgi:hypothetical protein